MRYLFLSLLIFICSNVFTQGNLQFNQVLNLSPGSSYTVPAGKVLKIESINFGSNSVCIPRSNTVNANCITQGGPWVASSYGIYDAVAYLSIGNMTFSTPSFSGNGGSSYCNGWSNPNCWNYSFTNLTFSLPIWLTEGKNVLIHSGAVSIHISAVEFNVIP
jgi:hypothetical protein